MTTVGSFLSEEIWWEETLFFGGAMKKYKYRAIASFPDNNGAVKIFYKERMKKKMEAKHFQAAASALALTNATNNSNNANTVQNNTLTDEQLIAFFNTCDKGEKTPRQLKPVSTSSNTNTITTSANDIAITPSDKKKNYSLGRTSLMKNVKPYIDPAKAVPLSSFGRSLLAKPESIR